MRLAALTFGFFWACASPRVAAHPEPEPEPIARPVPARVVDPERALCLEPPYMPAADSVLEDGTQIRHEGGSWFVSIRGQSSATSEAISLALPGLREHPGLTFLSYGLYCDQRLCLNLERDICETHFDAMLNEVRAALADSPLRELSVELRFSLSGRLGPRCAPTDPLCEPIAYENDTQGNYRADGPRYGNVMRRYSEGRCEHDGDCEVGGCGNHCRAWDLFRHANEIGTCEGYTFSVPTFCGCVEGACQWFQQSE